MAGFWRRFLAFQIDIALIAVVLTGVLKLLGLVLSGARMPLVANVLMLGAGLAYWPAFNASKWKGTPGKRFLNLRVTDLRGARLELSKSISRHVLSIFLAPGFILSGVTRKRQAGHDLVAKTLVLKKSSTHTEARAKLEFCAGVVVSLLAPAYVLAMLLPPLPVHPGDPGRPGLAPRVDDTQILSLDRAVLVNLAAASAVQAYVDLTFQATGKLPQQFLPELVSSAKKAPGTSLRVDPATAEVLIVFEKPAYAGEQIVLKPRHADPAIRTKPGSAWWLCSSPDIPDAALPPACRRGAP